MLSTIKITKRKLRVFFQGALSGLLKHLQELPRFVEQPKPLKIVCDDYVMHLNIRFAKITKCCYCVLYLCSANTGRALYPRPHPYREYAPLSINPKTYEKQADSCHFLGYELFNTLEVDSLQKDCEQTAFIDNAIREFYARLKLVKADIELLEQKNPTLAQELQYRNKK